MKTIALLTDFGLADNYVGVMKGVILNINPNINIVDISHKIISQDIFQAAFLLKGSFKYFPKGTIFVVVVDPGVGSKRKPVIVCTKNYLLVGPDNGVLSLAANEEGIEGIILIENKKYFLETPVSDTFHGRDIFAPVAGFLSKGEKPNLFGRPLNSIRELNLPEPKVNSDSIRGEIIYIDKFGNLATNIEKDLFKRFTQNKTFKIKIKDTKIKSIAKSYQAINQGEPLAIFGSFGFLEISVNKGSAEKYFKAKKGTSVEVIRRFTPPILKRGGVDKKR